MSSPHSALSEGFCPVKLSNSEIRQCFLSTMTLFLLMLFDFLLWFHPTHCYWTCAATQEMQGCLTKAKKSIEELHCCGFCRKSRNMKRSVLQSNYYGRKGESKVKWDERRLHPQRKEDGNLKKSTTFRQEVAVCVQCEAKGWVTFPNLATTHLPI